MTGTAEGIFAEAAEGIAPTDGMQTGMDALPGV